MTTTVEAVYEQGVLRLLQPIPLPEGTRVEVTVVAQAVDEEQSAPADILAAIAALPMEQGGKEFSGRDHDAILFPPARHVEVVP